jgi:hypothetical protein
MRSANNKTNTELIKQLERAKELIEACIHMARTHELKALAGRKSGHHSKVAQGYSDIDFSKPIRPFIKLYGARLSSGPKKFTLVLAYLAGGVLSKNVSSDEIRGCWDRMTSKSMLGMKFNGFYSATAKDNDWVNTEKNGLYHLRPSWKEIFNAKR